MYCITATDKEYIPQFGDIIPYKYSSSNRKFVCNSKDGANVICEANNKIGKFSQLYTLTGLCFESFLSLIGGYPEHSMKMEWEGYSLRKFSIDGVLYEYDNTKVKSLPEFFLRVALEANLIYKK